jgi:hypothetical protein
MSRTIAWEKWQDFDSEELEEKLSNSIDDESGEELKRVIVPMMIRTPFGDYSPFETMNPSKMYDCWVCHTNFDITKHHENLLNQIDGIEVLKIMTRYRIFIGIGKLFSLTDVRPKVNVVLNVSSKLESDKIMEEIEGYDIWAVFIYENGDYKIIVHDGNDDEYDGIFEELLDSGYVSLIKSDDFSEEQDLPDEDCV